MLILKFYIWFFFGRMHLVINYSDLHRFLGIYLLCGFSLLTVGHCSGYSNQPFFFTHLIVNLYLTTFALTYSVERALKTLSVLRDIFFLRSFLLVLLFIKILLESILFVYSAPVPKNLLEVHFVCFVQYFYLLFSFINKYFFVFELITVFDSFIVVCGFVELYHTRLSDLVEVFVLTPEEIFSQSFMREVLA